MSENSCEVFQELQNNVANTCCDINNNELQSVSNFYYYIQSWYKDNKLAIEECAESLPYPGVDEPIGYSRNVQFTSESGEYIAFIHRMKLGGETALHNHGENGQVFIVPLTSGLVEQKYLHNITDNGDFSKVSFYPIGETTLEKGMVSHDSHCLIHKVSNPSDQVQSFVEVYFPRPENMKIYVPFEGEENSYMQLTPIQTNMPYYLSLSQKEDVTEFTCDNLKNLDNFTIFTDCGTVIQELDELSCFIVEHGCGHVMSVEGKYILFGENASIDVNVDV